MSPLSSWHPTSCRDNEMQVTSVSSLNTFDTVIKSGKNVKNANNNTDLWRCHQVTSLLTSRWEKVLPGCRSTYFDWAVSLSLVTCLENKESSNIVSKLELSIYKELVNTIENIQASWVIAYRSCSPHLLTWHLKAVTFSQSSITLQASSWWFGFWLRNLQIWPLPSENFF